MSWMDLGRCPHCDEIDCVCWKINWRWPETKEHPENFPWFVVLWRILWSVPLCAAQLFFVLMVLIFSWNEDTEKAWRAVR